jgi:hypothetical protein
LLLLPSPIWIVGLAASYLRKGGGQAVCFAHAGHIMITVCTRVAKLAAQACCMYRYVHRRSSRGYLILISKRPTDGSSYERTHTRAIMDRPNSLNFEYITLYIAHPSVLPRKRVGHTPTESSSDQELSRGVQLSTAISLRATIMMGVTADC